MAIINNVTQAKSNNPADILMEAKDWAKKDFNITKLTIAKMNNCKVEELSDEVIQRIAQISVDVRVEILTTARNSTITAFN